LAVAGKPQKLLTVMPRKRFIAPWTGSEERPALHAKKDRPFLQNSDCSVFVNDLGYELLPENLKDC